MDDADGECDPQTAPRERLAPTPEWPVIESVAEYETGWYTGGYDRVEQPDGTEKRYYWAALPPSVVVVARHRDDVLFVEQYRPAVRERCLELPAGIVESGETYAEAGTRELREETGFAAADATVLQEQWCSTGVLRHRRAVVVARTLHETGAGGDPDSNEFLDLVRIPADEALEAARKAPANDATLEGLLLATVDGRL